MIENNKMEYEPAEFEIILFENDDVITTSGPEPFPGEDDEW